MHHISIPVAVFLHAITKLYQTNFASTDFSFLLVCDAWRVAILETLRRHLLLRRDSKWWFVLEKQLRFVKWRQKRHRKLWHFQLTSCFSRHYFVYFSPSLRCLAKCCLLLTSFYSTLHTSARCACLKVWAAAWVSSQHCVSHARNIVRYIALSPCPAIKNICSNFETNKNMVCLAILKRR